MEHHLMHYTIPLATVVAWVVMRNIKFNILELFMHFLWQYIYINIISQGGLPTYCL